MRKKSEIVNEWWWTQIVVHSLIIKRELKMMDEYTFERCSNYYHGRTVGLEFALGIKTSFKLGLEFDEKFSVSYMWEGIEDRDETFLRNMLINFDKELALLDDANTTNSNGQ